jgi:hypothetical protein
MSGIPHPLSRSPRAILLLAILVVALGGGSYVALANAAKKTDARFYSARDYRPDHSSYEYSAIHLGSMTCRATQNEGGGAEFTIRFELPDGAEIKKITAHYFDNDTVQDIRFGPYFSEVGLSDELFEGGSSSGASEDMRSVEMTPPAPVTVDNGNRRYGVMAIFEACNDSGLLAVDGVRVEYTR